MPDDFIKIEVQGLERIQAALSRFPREIAKYLGQAGNEAASRIVLPTEGLKKYPPAGDHPPQPFVSDKQRRYFFAALRRGEIEVPYRRGQSPKSERYGTQWYVRREGFSTEIGNRASYAPYLAGERQSRYMASLGWRQLVSVANEKLSDIVRVYQAWADKLLRDLGL